MQLEMREAGPGLAGVRAWSCFEPVEQLEARMLLSDTPLPAPADFEDPSNPAIRLTTRWGEIDIELLAHEVPDLVNAYIQGLERGSTCDQTFFHRLLPGIVLQGGLYGFNPDLGIGAYPVNLPVEGPVGSGRANTERTIAVGPLLESGLLGVSSLIINLTDNSERWDPVTEAVVFARVIDDRSWDVVLAIASFDVADLTLDPSFAGFFAGSFHDVPVTGPYTPPNSEENEPGTPITNDLLTTMYDLAIIKDVGAPDFYRHTLYEAEGFLHSRIREFVPIENPNDEPVHFELTARYETSGRRALVRDDLVFRGVIAPHSRGGVTIVIGDSSEPEAIDYADIPFALELRSTLPLAATLSHYDFGSSVDMAFSADLATTWFFPRVVKLADVQDFLVWYNPGGENAEVSVTLIDQDGMELEPIVFQTDRFRRGGINLEMHDDVPEGVFGVRIDSTRPISVSRSHYAVSGPPRSRPEGYSEPGAAGGASTVGIIPIAGAVGIGDSASVNVSFFNPGPGEAVINAEFIRLDGTRFPGPGNLTVGAGASISFQMGFAPGGSEGYAMSYRASAPVYASYWLERPEAIYGGAVPVAAATEYHFAEGFTDPGRAAPNVLEDVLHIFNPNDEEFGLPTADANVRITFRFTDGFELSIDRAIGAGRLGQVNISGLEEIIEQGVEHERFYYSVEVTSDVPIVAQMLHTDVNLGTGALSGGGFILCGTIFGEMIRLGEEPRLS